MDRKTLAIGVGLGMIGAAGVGLGSMLSRRRRSRADDRQRGMGATFTGDIAGGGPGGGADLGRGGSSTSIGDIAGGGEPGSTIDFGEGTVTMRDAVPTGGAGTAVDRGATRVRGGERPEPARNTPRSATQMAPGIPTGSGRGIDRALGQPDTEIGGGVAGDTTVENSDGRTQRDERSVRNDDAKRTTM